MLPLPPKVPKGVTITKMIRVSPGSQLGHWFGCVQVDGWAVPSIRVLSPAAIWLVALPVWTATQSHAGGFGLAQSSPTVLGQGGSESSWGV